MARDSSRGRGRVAGSVGGRELAIAGGQRALFREGGERFEQEQRVAAGHVLEAVEEGGGAGGAGGFANKVVEADGAEAGEGDVAGGGFTPEPFEDVGEGIVGRGRAAPQRDERDRHGLAAGGEVDETGGEVQKRLQGVGLGPVQVVDDEEQGTAASEGGNGAGKHAVQGGIVAVRPGSGQRGRGRGGERLQCGGGIVAAGGGERREGVAQAGNEGVGEGEVGRMPAFEEAAGGDLHGGVFGQGLEFAGEAALSHAGLAADDGDAGLAGARGMEEGAKERDLVVAPGEGGGDLQSRQCRRAHRELLPPDTGTSS